MVRGFDPLAERPFKGVSFLVLYEAGVVVEHDVVRVPFRLPDGRVQRWQFFAPSGRTWWGVGDGLLPFGLETLSMPVAAERVVFVCEGESDALAVRESFAGSSDGSIVWSTIGLPGASTWRPEWRVHLEPCPLVYVVGDGDPAGRRMMDAVLGDVPWARPVLLPDGEDARSILQAQGPRALDPFLAAADRRAELLAALRLAGSLDELEELLGLEVGRAA